MGPGLRRDDKRENFNSLPAMSTYVVGDLQGCADSFEALLANFAFDPCADRVWLVGDLVNRGPDSLATLRRVIALGSAATVVLGNHDLHLLGVSAGVRKAGRGDTLAPVLAAPDAASLIDWLRHRPLAHRARIGARDVLMIHAGVLPAWSTDDTMRHAAELEAALRADDWRSTLGALFGNRPDRWDDALAGTDRLRAIVNALTRLRYCSNDGRIDFDAKDAPAAAGSNFPAPPEGYRAWFDIEGRRSRDTLVVFGHWSTLGLMVRDDVIALDSGCVWGGALTAVRLEDRMVFQVPCARAKAQA
jgi:bis(5'-nucleosyl)-tetraphosphatase (symmetrical)